MNIPGYVARNARKYPQQQAVVEPNVRHTWAQLDQRVNQLANYLHDEHGIEAGHRVALFLPNNFAFIVSYFAVQRLGAVVVPISVRLATPQLQTILDDCGADLVITCEATGTAVQPLYEDDTSAIWLDNIDDLLNGLDSDSIDITIDNDDACTLVYTIDTNGEPRGVLFNHSALQVVGTMFAMEMSYTPQSRLLSLMPYSHAAALHYNLVAGTLVGCTHIVAPDFSPHTLFDLAENERATHFFGSADTFALSAQHPDIQTCDLNSVTHWIYAAGSLSAAHLESLQPAFKTGQWYGVFGLTESGPSGCILLPYEHAAKAGSLGKRAMFNTEVRVVNDEGDLAEIGQPGELQITGEGIMLGYWQNPDATDDILTQDGWLKTGEIAVRDAEGYFWLNH